MARQVGGEGTTGTGRKVVTGRVFSTVSEEAAAGAAAMAAGEALSASCDVVALSWAIWTRWDGPVASSALRRFRRLFTAVPQSDSPETARRRRQCSMPGYQAVRAVNENGGAQRPEAASPQQCDSVQRALPAREITEQLAAGFEREK